jgi:hypothetical protein
LAAVFVLRLARTAAFAGAGGAVLLLCALGDAGFRFAGLLDWDLVVVLVLFASMRPDIRIPERCANL